MLRNRIYYRLKPMLPEGLRMALRRRHARAVRKRSASVWPILPGSERPPDNWPGWPGGKKFAVVLTHDVEGIKGIEKCRKLMKLEQDCGFVSSFNFIPEGKYRTPAELRAELTTNGFEVGVHDFNHDGHLYDSPAGFARKAEGINRYLKEWHATGFRSGFMLNRLDWLHALDIAYDASTFDTDPYEPQPDGQHTIFPFWVPAPGAVGHSQEAHRGYVELPYTLTQDSTLFLLLQETTPEIWLRKADWVAEHGGMVLVNVHPDYMAFDEPSQDSKTFPSDYYRSLLIHLREHYGDTFWQPLPREMAAFVAGLETKPRRRKPRRVAMVTHSFYEQDTRVMRYAEALAARGDEVDILALRRGPDLPSEEALRGVRLRRVTNRDKRQRKGKFALLWQNLRFLWTAARTLAQEHRQRPYDVVHIHNLPDFLVFAAWYPKWKGAAVLLDIHDIMPEFFVSKFSTPQKGLLFDLLCWVERCAAAFSDHVIVANDLWLEKYAARTRMKGRCSAWINNVDAVLFAPQTSTRRDGRLIVLFPGGLYWHQGVDLAIHAFKRVSAEVPEAEFHIYGDGDAREALIALAWELELTGQVKFFDPVPARQIATIMGDADLGVVPKRADSFGNEAYSTKIMEFMSLGVPVVASNTQIDRHYFDDSVIRFFESGRVDELAQAMVEMLQDRDARMAQAASARDYAVRNSWQNRRKDFYRLVDSLCDARKQ